MSGIFLAMNNPVLSTTQHQLTPSQSCAAAAWQTSGLDQRESGIESEDRETATSADEDVFRARIDPQNNKYDTD